MSENGCQWCGIDGNRPQLLGQVPRKQTEQFGIVLCTGSRLPAMACGMHGAYRRTPKCLQGLKQHAWAAVQRVLSSGRHMAKGIVSACTLHRCTHSVTHNRSRKVAEGGASPSCPQGNNKFEIKNHPLASKKPLQRLQNVRRNDFN